MAQAPSGEQHEIRHGDQRVTIVEVGGGIRSYDVGERPVLDPFGVGELCDGGHGSPLVPWPNRLGDGRYTFDGHEHQLALTEPKHGGAIHGLLRWRPWVVRDRSTSHVVVGARLHPMSGYPFDLDVEIAYTLDDDGLTVRTTATNVGGHDLPYGSGHHPYLSPGTGLVDGCVLRVDAATRITTDERQLPNGTEPVDGTPYDFREPRLIGDLALDDAFTDLVRDADARAWIRLTGVDGLTAALWADASYPVLQAFTADSLAPGRQRRGFAAEPMTCPADAFRTGDHLIRLSPGATTTSTWGALLQ